MLSAESVSVFLFFRAAIFPDCYALGSIWPQLIFSDEVTGGVHEYVFIIYEQRLSASTEPASLSTGGHPGEEGTTG